MDAINKERVEEILEEAAGLDQSKRLAFVNHACNGDAVMAAEVCSLLNAGDEGSLRDLLNEGLPQIMNSMVQRDAEPQSDSEVQNLKREEAEEERRWVGAFVGDEFEGKGKYQILELRRFGLMASLFFAKDRRLNRTVVIKIPRMSAYVESADDDDNSKDAKTNIRNNFKREFDALRELGHCSYVVDVLDFGDLPDGRPFMILEFINGKNGLELLETNDTRRKSGLALKDVASIIRQAGKGLEAAHELKILHRDMKAENVMVSDDGHVRLIDFNAADVKLPISPLSTVFKHQTWGTLGYTSPEQLKNMLGSGDDYKPIELTAASDVYSLAVTAYQLITGQLPFSRNLADLIKEQMHCSFPAAGKLRPGLNPEVDVLLRAALDYDPAERPQSAKEFGEQLGLALEKLGRDETVRPMPPSPPSQRSKFLVGAVVILLLAAAGFGLRYLPSIGSGPISNANVSATPEVAPTATNTPPLSSQPPRTFSYWLALMRADDNGKCVTSSSIRASGDEPFTNGDCFVVHFESPQAGYLYLINEGRNYKDLVTFYYQERFQIRSNKPEESLQLSFDVKDGVEQFWLLFSKTPVPLLESYGAPRELPEEKTEEIRAFLKQNVPADLSAQENLANALTEVKGSGDTLAYKKDFRHRKKEVSQR